VTLTCNTITATAIIEILLALDQAASSLFRMESVGIDIAKDAVVIATTIVVHAITKTTTITAVVNMLVNSTKTGILEGCMSDDW